MEKDKINIGILETSDIIYEGILALLSKSNTIFIAHRFKELSDLQVVDNMGDISVFLVNPALIQNRVHEFIKIKKANINISWVGLIYDLFDENIMNKLDGVFSIHEKAENLLQNINRHIKTDDGANEMNEDLTERETEILKLICQGFLNKEIADNLNISIHTVISHRKNIVEKTGIKSTAGLTIFAISKNIISID